MPGNSVLSKWVCAPFFQNKRFKKPIIQVGGRVVCSNIYRIAFFIKLYTWLAYRNLNLFVSHTRTRPKVLDECRTDQTGNDTSRVGCEHNDGRSAGTEAEINKIIIKKGAKGLQNGTRWKHRRPTILRQWLGQGEISQMWLASPSLPSTIKIPNFLFNKNAFLLKVKVASHMHLANRSTCHSQTRHKTNNHVYNNQDANRKNRVIIIIITYT